jgi:hypothetical protein
LPGILYWKAKTASGSSQAIARPRQKHAEMLPATPAVPALQRPWPFYAVGERLASLNAKGAA